MIRQTHNQYLFPFGIFAFLMHQVYSSIRSYSSKSPGPIYIFNFYSTVDLVLTLNSSTICISPAPPSPATSQPAASAVSASAMSITTMETGNCNKVATGSNRLGDGARRPFVFSLKRTMEKVNVKL